MSEATTSQYDNPDLRKLKKDIQYLIKENQKLQSDVKTKNETIHHLMDQNYSELKNLQEKHDKIVNSVVTNYDTNVKNLDSIYVNYKRYIVSKYRDSVNTHCSVNNERIKLLADHNKELITKIDSLNNIQNEVDNLKILNVSHNVRLKELEEANVILDRRNRELHIECENNTVNKENYESIIASNTHIIQTIKQNLSLTKDELEKQNEVVETLTVELETIKKTSDASYHKNLLLLNDNFQKQTCIDEKTLDILSLNSKIAEIEKKIKVIDQSRTDVSVKNLELINQLDDKTKEIYSQQKNLHQLRIENDNIMDEKIHYVRELADYKSKLSDVEKSVIDRIKQVQESSRIELGKAISDYEYKIRDMKDRHEKLTCAMRHDYNTTISDKEKQIDGLTKHLKSFVDNQYHILSEMENVKMINDKLKVDQLHFDQRISDIMIKHKSELEEYRTKHNNEFDVLNEAHNEMITRAQEIRDTLESKLDQSLDALSLAKTSISNLKETNDTLKHQVSLRDTDENNVHDKYTQLRNENEQLKEKMDKLIEINNNHANNEKKYNLQVMQLQSKYEQLSAMAKKHIIKKS